MYTTVQASQISAAPNGCIKQRRSPKSDVWYASILSSISLQYYLWDMKGFFLNIQPDNKKSPCNINFGHEGVNAKFIWEQDRNIFFQSHLPHWGS